MVGRYRKNFGAATMFRCDRAQMNSAFRRLLKAILAPERTAAIKAKAAQPQVSTCDNLDGRGGTSARFRRLGRPNHFKLRLWRPVQVLAHSQHDFIPARGGT